ncbi:MAG: hypothetical protein J1F42_08025 [Lachnospiraceae bacterium]|nr:hypothetical protein [Lachnospiraceae bacterium]
MWNRQIIMQITQKMYCNLRIHAAAAGALACVWWGILYPELCFSDSTYEQVVADSGEVEAKQGNYQDILGAAGNEIVIKSRLLEWIESKIEKH